MKFQTAMVWMVEAGKKITAPGFIGYWFWDQERREIIIVTKDNVHIPMSQTNNWGLTLGFICSDEWELYNGPEDPRVSEKYKEIFGDKFKPIPFNTEVNEHNASVFSKVKGWEKALLVNKGFNLVGVSDVNRRLREPQPIEINSDFRIERINMIIEGTPRVFRLSELDAQTLKVNESGLSHDGHVSHTVRIAVAHNVDVAVILTINTKTATASTHVADKDDYVIDSIELSGSFTPC